MLYLSTRGHAERNESGANPGKASSARRHRSCSNVPAAWRDAFAALPTLYGPAQEVLGRLPAGTRVTGYADALSGAALAGGTDSPLFVVPSNCVPQAVLDSLDDFGVTTVRLLGGVGVLSARVAALLPC